MVLIKVEVCLIFGKKKWLFYKWRILIFYTLFKWLVSWYFRISISDIQQIEFFSTWSLILEFDLLQDPFSAILIAGDLKSIQENIRSYDIDSEIVDEIRNLSLVAGMIANKALPFVANRDREYFNRVKKFLFLA